MMNVYSLVLSILVSFIVSRSDAFGIVPTTNVVHKNINNRNVIPSAIILSSNLQQQQTVVEQQKQQKQQNLNKKNNIFNNIEKYVLLASTVLITTIPHNVLAAVVEDDYEYGKVDAPIGLAVGVGILTILTALLPLALQGGEEAFNEIRDRDSSTFGKSNKDVRI
jgi:hypothetical protein